MPGLTEATQIKREDLADWIAVVDAKDTPVTSMLPKGKEPGNTLMTFTMDKYSPPRLLGWLDGQDVTDFENAQQNRRTAQIYIQEVRRTFMVSDMAQEVSVSPGEPDPYAGAIAIKLTEIKRDIESIVCSDQETQLQAGSAPYQTRGIGVWCQHAAQTVLPVDANYLTPAANIDTTASASFFDETVQAVLQSVFQQTGQYSEFDLVCGPSLKRNFTKLMRYASGTNNYATLRVFNAEANGKEYMAAIDVFGGDFGLCRLHPTMFNAVANADTVGGVYTPSAATLYRGYCLRAKSWELRYGSLPRVKELPDLGGGPRGMIRARIALLCKNPLDVAKFAATS